MATTPKSPDKQQDSPSSSASHRWQAIGLVITLIAVGWLVSNHTHRDPSPNDVVTVTTATAKTTPSSTAPTSTIVTVPRPGRDVSWRVFAGMDLPVSATAGPFCLTETRAKCFAHTDNGAAIAAAQLLVRTFPFAGSVTFGPTIAEQVNGPGAPALARLTQQAYNDAAQAADVHNGQAIRSSDGWIAGYEAPQHDDHGITTVRVLVVDDGENYGFTAYTLHLTWQDGDWRLIAPDWGDWRNSAHPVANPYPSSYRSYDQLGLGTGGAS